MGEKQGNDWMDNLGGQVQRYLEFIPYISQLSQLINTLQGDEKISSGLEELPSELRDQGEFLRNIMAWSTNRLVENQSTHFGDIQDELESIKKLLTNFSRVNIAGQLSGVFAEADAIAQIRRLADQAEKMAGSLKAIEQNLNAINMQGEKFPQHVHSYVRMMIDKHSAEEVPHYFAVFHRGTQWHAAFHELDRANPLGPNYLGHRADLDELCAFLVEEVRPQIHSDSVLHILMPSTKPVAILEAVKFPEAMRPFFIDGERGDEGSPFVWLCTPEQYDQEHLRHIGILKQREIYVLQARVGVPILSSWFDSLSYISEPKFFIDPYYRLSTDVTLWVAGGVYRFCGLEPPRTLGQPSRRPWRGLEWDNFKVCYEGRTEVMIGFWSKTS